MKWLSCIFVSITVPLALASCASSSSQVVASTPPTDTTATQSELPNVADDGDVGDITALPLDKRIYLFQHQVLPDWTFQTDGAFLTDLLNHNTQALKETATEVVSAEFARGISVDVVNPAGAALLTFDSPQNTLDCYYVFILGADGEHLFFTYERTADIQGEGFIGEVGMWTQDGIHASFGLRKYADAKSFMGDVKGILLEASRQHGDTSRPHSAN
ncbi:MAG: hypothetical protein JXR76_11970 [Deltaproteobacteria bacterium]|nr:hypothetical protein [Deltaproteobacteria bacterium]